MRKEPDPQSSPSPSHSAQPPASSPVPPSSHIWVVDQINERSVTIEVDGSMTMTVPVWMLPKEAREGDVFRVKHDRRTDRSILMIVTDDEERRRRLEESAEQMAAPPQGPPGDITL